MEKDSGLTDSEKMKIFEMSDQLFGLDLTRSINESELLSELSELQKSLLAQRVTARSDGDFKASDRLREELLAVGIAVQDTKEGQSWSFKN
jgi:cysteinyl-tRNA synthetase